MFQKSLLKIALASAMLLPVVSVGAGIAAAQDKFGAIARSSQTGGKGYSWNYATRAAAERRSLSECESVSGTQDCEVLVWFKNACGSIAESSNGGAGTGWGTSTTLAERYALESCSGIGQGCKVVRTICTDR